MVVLIVNYIEIPTQEKGVVFIQYDNITDIEGFDISEGLESKTGCKCRVLDVNQIIEQ